VGDHEARALQGGLGGWACDKAEEVGEVIGKMMGMAMEQRRRTAKRHCRIRHNCG